MHGRGARGSRGERNRAAEAGIGGRVAAARAHRARVEDRRTAPIKEPFRGERGGGGGLVVRVTEVTSGDRVRAGSQAGRGQLGDGRGAQRSRSDRGRPVVEGHRTGGHDASRGRSHGSREGDGVQKENGVGV